MRKKLNRSFMFKVSKTNENRTLFLSVVLWNTDQLSAKKTRSAHRLSCCQDTWPGFCHQSKSWVGAFITPLTALWLWVMDISPSSVIWCFSSVASCLEASPFSTLWFSCRPAGCCCFWNFSHTSYRNTASCPCESSCGSSSCRSEWTVSRTVNKNTASLRGLSWSSRMASWSWTSSQFLPHVDSHVVR